MGNGRSGRNFPVGPITVGTPTSEQALRPKCEQHLAKIGERAQRRVPKGKSNENTFSVKEWLNHNNYIIGNMQKGLTNESMDNRIRRLALGQRRD